MPKGVQSFVTVGADGSVSFDFNGHISAAGIDMLSGTSSTPPDDRKIRWHQDPSLSGTVLAEIFSFGGPTNDDLILRSDSPDGTGQAQLDLFASNVAAASPSQAIVTLDGAEQVLLLDADNKSGYIQDGKALSGGRRIRVWDVPTATTTLLAPGTDQLITINHGLGLGGLGQIILGFTADGSNSQRITWGTRNVLPNSFDIVFFNAGGINASAVWIGEIMTFG